MNRRPRAFTDRPNFKPSVAADSDMSVQFTIGVK